MTTTQISELYVSIFNRASEKSGNEFWAAKDLTDAQIADEMLATADATTYFGTSIDTNQAFVEAIYSNTLNKTTADDAEGIAYWVALLDGGASKGTVVSSLVSAVADYADSTDAATMAAYDQFTARVAVSDDAAVNVLTAPSDYATTMDFATGLTVTGAADVDAAKTAITAVAATAAAEVAADEDAVETVGATIAFTDGIDALVGTSANDKFVGDKDTFSAADQVAGGTGTDTIELYDTFAAAPSLNTLDSVEVVKVMNDATRAYDASGNEDINELWLNAASVNAATATVDQIIGFSDVNGGAAAVATFTSVTGSEDSATIAVSDAGKTTDYTSIAVAGVETLTINATGNNDLGNIIAAAATSITVTGTGSVEGVLVPATTVLKSVDASTNSGGVDLSLTDAQFAANPIMVTTGSGDDKITFTDALGAKATVDLGEGDNTLTITQAATALTTASTFMAGAGSDTLNLSTTTTSIDEDSGEMFTGFETIKLTGTSAYTVGDIAGITGYELAAGTGTLTNMQNDSIIKVSGTSVAALTLKDSEANGAASAVTLQLDNGKTDAAAAAGITVTTLATNAHVVNIESNGNVTGGDNTLTLTGTSLAQVTNIAITGDQDATLVTGIATALTLIDGSAATGDLTLTATATTSAVTIKGGSGDDAIAASAGVDTIVFGATVAANGEDTITGYTNGTDFLNISSLFGSLVGTATLAEDSALSAAKIIVATTDAGAGDTITEDLAALNTDIDTTGTVTGTTLLFVEQATDLVKVYLYEDDANAAAIEEGEITLLATINGTVDAGEWAAADFVIA